MTVNPVDAALKAAEEQAAQAPAQTQAQTQTQPAANQTVDVVPAGANQNGVQTYQATSAPSLDDLEQGTMTVDGWLKVKEFGLLIGDKVGKLVKTIKVKLNTAEGGDFRAFEGVRFGNPPQYLKTYDGINEASGGTWAEALRKAQLVEPTNQSYRGADLQMEVIEDVKHDDGTLLAETGMRLGHSTAVTNRPQVADLVKQLKEMNLMGKTVDMEVGFIPKSNKNGQTWGLLTFKVLGESK